MKTQAAIDRIKAHVAQLERSDVHKAHRFMLWRLIIAAAHDGHDAELQQSEVAKTSTPRKAAGGA